MTVQFKFLHNKRILLAGGAGFLGKHCVQKLLDVGVVRENVIVPRSSAFDLRSLQATQALFEKERPDIVINAAARLGGIGDNRAFPASYLYDNVMIGLHLIEACRMFQVQKLVNIGTVCSYPKFVDAPFSEDDLWNGYPEETNAPYGIAKKTVMVYGEAAFRQYGLVNVNLLLTNLYGPGDDFRDATSHVIPAIIKKIVSAKKKGATHIEAWGDGSPSRDFLYVEDAAEAIVLATALHKEPSPVNLGAGKEITIKELIAILMEQIGFSGSVKWDTSKPNGQPRRVLDTSKAERCFGFRSTTSFREGLAKTIQWYLDHQEQLDALGAKYASMGSSASDLQ